jgi:[acyl-carrier-protein] S-malonyltransferase
MGLALLFSGQGSQHAEMLPWLDGAWRQAAGDPTQWTSNRVAQPLIAGVQLAAWARLAPELPAPCAVAGYSVGELAAFSAAGALSAEDAVALASVRASAMDTAMAGRAAGMVAVRDVPLPVIEAWCARYGLEVAIVLAEDRAIVGGLDEAFARAWSDGDLARARVDRLAIGVPSHTSWMAPAADAFGKALAARPLSRATVPLISNFTGAIATRPDELALCLSRQIATVVRWDRCLAAVAERGASCVLEIGPGSALAAMWRERYPQVPARSVDEFRSAAAIAQWTHRMLARAG